MESEVKATVVVVFGLAAIILAIGISVAANRWIDASTTKHCIDKHTPEQCAKIGAKL